MSLPYFFEKELQAGTTVFTLGEETSKHCVKVLRMAKGDALHLTNGNGLLCTAEIREADKRATTVQITTTQEDQGIERKISLAVSLLKNNSRLEWMLEKATEIGVHSIIPLLCQRTERQHFRFDRMNNILIAAMLQSQQTWLPQLQMPVSFEAVLRCTQRQKLIAHCTADEKVSLSSLNISDDVVMLIGPEGDFTDDEIAAAKSHGFRPVSLGETRLRTETAGIVAATLLMNG